MRRLILHIGDYKTGSTSIQRIMMTNQQALLDRGILYPGKKNDAFIQGRQHVPVSAALTGQQVSWLTEERVGLDPKTILSALRRALDASESETVVISSEAFFGICRSAKRVQQVVSGFADFDVRALVYIRRQDDELVSGYQQQCKRGRWRPLAPDSRIYTRQPGFYRRRLQSWVDVIGKSNLVVRPFERSQWHNQDLIVDFLRQIGLEDLSEFTFPGNANESVSGEMVELLRMFNAWIRRQGQDPESNFWQNNRRVLMKLDGVIAKHPAGVLLNREQRHRKIQQFAAENAWIAEEFLGRPSGLLFDQTVPVDADHQPGIKISQPQMLAVIDALRDRNRGMADKHELSQVDPSSDEEGPIVSASSSVDQLLSAIQFQIERSIRLRLLRRELRGRPPKNHGDWDRGITVLGRKLWAQIDN